MAIRRALRFRRFTSKTILGTTRLKRSIFTSGGLRSVKSPFRKAKNFTRGIRRQFGLERFLPTQILRAKRTPLLGGFSLLPRLGGRGRSGGSRGRRGGFGPRQGVVAAQRASNAAVQRVIRQAFRDLGRQIGDPTISVTFKNRGGSPPRAPRVPSTPKGPKRGPQAPRISPRRQAQLAAQRARAARANAKRTNAPAKRIRPPSRSRIPGNVPHRTRRPSASSRHRAASTAASKTDRIRRMLETKRKKGQISQIFYPGKPPKGYRGRKR